MKFYVAGPMRGYHQFNFPMFDEAAEYLRRKGQEVISPAEMDRDLGFDETVEAELALDGFDMSDAVRRDVDAVIEADAILLLPGWEQSSGVQFELAAARFLGKPVWYYVPTTPSGMTPGQMVPDDPKRCAYDTPDVTGEFTAAVLPPFYDAVDHSTTETRITDPNTGGQKGQKLARMDLLPWDALVVLAEHFGKGAIKYEARNWERGYPWSLSAAAAQRHFAAWWQGRDVDEEGYQHLTAWAWHAITLVAQALRGAGTDDRPKTTSADLAVPRWL